MDRELQELEAWREKTAKLQRVAQLKKAQAKYLAGDVNALGAISGGPSGHHTAFAAPSARLPTPQAPHTFAKRTRVDFNCWKRDCERYFDLSPANFLQEYSKVDFGVQYVSETMKSLWQAYATDQRRQSASWEASWEDMKAVMLGSLGTPSERRQRAYEALNRAQMLPHQSPTELLDYMRPYWEELGETHTPGLQVMGYIHALPEDIQKQLFMYPEERRTTLSQVEEIANTIHRQKSRSRPMKGDKAPKDREDSKKSSKGEGGSIETPKRTKEYGTGRNGPKRHKKTQDKSSSSSITCYGCGEVGHIKTRCPNPNKSKKPKEGQDGGKGKGRKE